MNEIPPSGVRRQAGSAYIIALLVLVVLTVIGLALTLITQTEVQIGATERSVNRSFYAADSGPNIALAGLLSKNWVNNVTLALNTTAQDTGASSNPTTYFADELTVTPLVDIADPPCPWTDIALKYSQSEFAVASTSTRTGIVGSAQAPLVKKTVTTMISVHCWPSTARASGDLDNALQKINPQ